MQSEKVQNILKHIFFPAHSMHLYAAGDPAKLLEGFQVFRLTGFRVGDMTDGWEPATVAYGLKSGSRAG